jgi:HlyD family secretion protein
MSENMKPSVLSAEALDFAPGLLSIQESPPGRLPRALLYTVGSLFVILLLWSFFGKINIFASAEGRLVPQTYVKIVQPSDSGIVQEILVKEGESVRAGQVLMRMDANVAQADSKTIGNDLMMRTLQLRRIDAELNDKPLVRDRKDAPDIFKQIESQYHDRRQSYRDSLGQAQESLKKSQREYESAKEVLTKYKDVMPILKDRAESYANMVKGGYVPKHAADDKERDYIEKAQDLRAQESTVASLEAAVNQAKKQIDQVTSKYRSDLQNERVDAEVQFRKLQQDLIKQDHKTALLELKAPQAGIVKDLATHTVGTVVSPGTVLLSIVPENEPLVAEVMIKNDDVGFVYPQQQVKVKLAPYPFEEYGMLDGEVVRIQADSDTDSQTQSKDSSSAKDKAQTPPSVYKAIISFKSQVLESDGQKLKLVPGMQVIAEINQGSRSVMRYLLSPVSKTLIESGHER